MPADRERALRAVAGAQMGLVTRAQAIAYGFPPTTIEGRLADQRWIAVLPRVYLTTGLPPTSEQFALAACLWAQPAAFSHRAAARTYALRGIEEPIFEITTSLRVRDPRIVVHRDLQFDREPLRHISGIPVTSVERTLMDLAAVVSPRRLEYATDDALARRLTTIPRLESKLRERALQGRNGTTSFRSIVLARQNLKAHPESTGETDLVAILRSAGVELPVAQHVLVTGGRRIGRFDFAYPHYGVLIEKQSMRWHSGRQDLQKDTRRQNAVVAAGMILLCYTDEDLTERPGEFVAEVAAAIELGKARRARGEGVL